MAQPKKTLYQILGVPTDANEIDIGLAYEKRTAEMQRAVPPDPSTEALLRQAYEVLSDPRRRAAYDASLVTAAEKAAAAEQAAAPDLLVEEDAAEANKARTKKGVALTIGIILVILVMYFALRPSRLPDPVPEKPAVAEAPKPVPPPPPRPLAPAEMLKHATTSGGQLVSVEMSGRSTPIGIALAIEPNAMVTTCHGIQAGRKLVVLVGKDTFAADLAITDETLDLCRLNVAQMGAKPLELAAAEPKAGERIFVSGVNAAGEFALTEGTIRKLVDTPYGKVLDLSVPIAPTASGGAVFNQFGRLVGVATTPHKYGPNLNIALPASWIPQLRSRGRSQ